MASSCLFLVILDKSKFTFFSEKDVTRQHDAQRQILLEEIFLVEDEWDSNNAESKEIDKLIGEMIALQTLPFNFVEGVGFRRLITALAPAYNFRGQRFFTDFVCEELYGRIAAKVKQLIQKFDYMSFSCDIRSDPSSNYTLLMFTCYGLTENFERSSATLKCEIISEDRHIDDTIAEKIDAILSEWNIKVEQVHGITWKKGSNIKNEKGAINDIDCIVHKIQLCIRSCLHSQENIKCVKQKCKEISAHFNDSTIAQKQLEIIQDKMNQPHHKVYQDGITRWNSAYYMFERFLKVKDALSFYFNENEIEPILDNDWKIIESCVMLLKPYEEVTRELSSSHALISSVIPLIQALRKNIEEYLTGPHDCDPIRLAANTLKTELCLKFSNLLQDNKFLIATFLDPRYKHKLFTPVTHKKIKEDILKMINKENKILSSPNYWEAKRKRMRDSSENNMELAGMSGMITKPSLLDHLALILESSSEDESQQTSNSTEAAFKKELLTYRNEKRINLNENPLTWWRVHCQKFKILSTLARRFLSPSAASFQSEQLFSNSDLINDPHLNRLDPEEAAILLFIKYNTPIFDFTY